MWVGKGATEMKVSSERWEGRERFRNRECGWVGEAEWVGCDVGWSAKKNVTTCTQCVRQEGTEERGGMGRRGRQNAGG